MIATLLRRLASPRGWETVYCAECGGWLPPHSH